MDSQRKEIRMKFSIIMTTWNRVNILPNTIRTILNQTYRDFELLIMDDGATDTTWEVLQQLAATDSRIRLFRHTDLVNSKAARERIISRQELMSAATGEWIYWVDDDDEIIYGTLEVLKHNIEANPDISVFNFGQIIFSLTGTTIKLANDLPDRDGEGMDHFDTGRVGTGGFVFKRDCLNHIVPLPNIDNVFDLAEWFGKQVDAWFDQHKPGVTHQLYGKEDQFDAQGNKIRECKWCGNPWGDDYVFMWLLTRKYKSKKLSINPYIAYIRTEPWAYERAINSGVMG